MIPAKATRKRTINRILSRLDATFLTHETTAYPSVYFIGTSSVCDIRCPYCPRQYYLGEVDSGLMDFEKFMRIAPYLEYAEEANFFGLGEPFLHPRFFDFLKTASQTGIKTSTSTHGMTLTPENIERIVETHLDELAISIDGADKKTFEFLRAGADFDVVTGNILRLRELKKKYDAKYPVIQIATAVSRHNVEQMPDMVRLAARLGAERIVFTDLILVNPDNSEISVSKTDVFHKYYAKAEEAGRRKGVDVLYFFQNPFPWKEDPIPEIRGGDKRYFCRDPWRMCIIDRLGNMKPCCYYPPNTGNVFQKSIEQVFNSRENRHLRQSLIRGRLPECCINCGMLTELNFENSQNSLNEAKEIFRQGIDKDLLTQEDVAFIEKKMEQYENMMKNLLTQKEQKPTGVLHD